VGRAAAGDARAVRGGSAADPPGGAPAGPYRAIKAVARDLRPRRRGGRGRARGAGPAVRAGVHRRAPPGLRDRPPVGSGSGTGWPPSLPCSTTSSC
jgi:hypothetical protein